MAHTILAHARAHELFRLDRDTGALYWRRNGRLAGTKPKPYVWINVGGRLYLAHRVVWLMEHGEFPALGLDHRNEVKHDNRPDNLRQATKSQNAQNVRATRSRRTPGALLGAYWHKQNGRWVSTIMLNGRARFLGCFDTQLEAHTAYLAAKRELHPFSTV